MSEKNIKNVRIIHKHDVEANWLKATSFIPKQGELIVYDIDDNYDYERFKIGDGTTLVNDLPFYACSWNDLLDRPFGDNGDGTVSKLDDKYLNPVGQTSFGHTLVIGDIHQYPYVDFTSSKRWYKVSDNTPTDFTGMTLESNSPDMSPGDEITMIMYDGYACSNTASATNAYVLFVAYGNKIYQTEVLGPGIYVQENITYWEGDYIGSITLPNHEFTKSVIKEEYIPDIIARVSDIPDGGVQADMAQNDSAAPDYVKNRTHYESKEDVNELLNIAWDGNIEGLTIGTSGEYTYDNVNGIYTFYKVSDTVLTDEQIKLVTRHISITNEYGTSEHHHLIGDLWQSIVDEGNVTDSFVYADYVLFVKSPSSDYNECGIYFAKVKEFSGSEQVLDAVTTSITTDEPIEYTKTVAHKLNEKFIPDTIARLKDVPAKPRIATVTLPASAWAGDAQPWSQVVTVNTVTANSKLDLQPTAQQIVSLQNSETTLMASNDGGTVTFWAIGTKPTESYTMQVLLTEVTYV